MHAIPKSTENIILFKILIISKETIFSIQIYFLKLYSSKYEFILQSIYVHYILIELEKIWRKFKNFKTSDAA